MSTALASTGNVVRGITTIWSNDARQQPKKRAPEWFLDFRHSGSGQYRVGSSLFSARLQQFCRTTRLASNQPRLGRHSPRLAYHPEAKPFCAQKAPSAKRKKSPASVCRDGADRRLGHRQEPLDHRAESAPERQFPHANPRPPRFADLASFSRKLLDITIWLGMKASMLCRTIKTRHRSR